jgi:hypothetical protein
MPGELFDVEISDQVMAAAVGQHTAGIRKQCGFVEGTLMFIGIYFGRKGATDKEISALCRKYYDSYIGRSATRSAKTSEAKYLSLRITNTANAARWANVPCAIHTNLSRHNNNKSKLKRGSKAALKN